MISVLSFTKFHANYSFISILLDFSFIAFCIFLPQSILYYELRDCRAVIIRDEEDESVPSVESPPSQSQQSNLYHNTSPTCSHLELGSNKKQKLTNDISLSTTHSLEENDSNNTISKIDKNQFQIYDSLLFDSKDNKENIATSEKRNVRRKSSAPKEKTAKGM